MSPVGEGEMFPSTEGCKARVYACSRALESVKNCTLCARMHPQNVPHTTRSWHATALCTGAAPWLQQKHTVRYICRPWPCRFAQTVLSPPACGRAGCMTQLPGLCLPGLCSSARMNIGFSALSLI